ncbi:hypothetical protein [Arthrobacter sp. VKM Ac-2550]|uniref:hypothetical protein n=1 Tax=Crystallibacter permensis TaxID=1938888 RepID=UPI0022268EE6|nr:hypothetical protein [Arthrobacter sp. VKM Ac-2550]MCW2130948.1 hypothetical protein [Arthrobacter sp. VKM Ac-2550]
MAVDLSGLPVLPDPDLLETEAAKIRQSGERASAAGRETKAVWAGIQAHYDAPEQETVYSAMDRVEIYGDEASAVATLIAAALEAFAATVRSLKPLLDAQVTAASVCYVESTPEDPDFGENKEADIQRAISGLAEQYAEAERLCADQIRQADPANVSGPPAWATHQDAAAFMNGTGAVLARVRSDRTRVTFDSGAIPHGRLDVRKLEILYVDGTRLAAANLSMTETSIRFRATAEVDLPRVTTTPDIGKPPAWALHAGNTLAAVDVGLTIWDKGSEQWNEDLAAHPEWDNWERLGSAATTVGFQGTGAVVGGTVGAAIGAAAGQALIPIPGVGAFIGGAVGGWVGSSAGSALGGLAQDLSEGEDLGDAIEDAAEEFWDGLWG